MAKILNGILGGGAGKVGGVVMSAWKGIDTLRAYSVPSNPNTSAQQQQRSLFAGVQLFASLVLATVIQTYWDPFSVKMSGFNKFMQSNLLSWTSPTDYANAILSEGSLEQETIDSCTYDDVTGVITMLWTPTGLGNGEDSDASVVVIVDTANNIAFVNDEGVRNDDGAAFNIGADRTPADLKAYVFFTRGSGETLTVSNSDYYQVTAA